jgi:hypothetical protein
MRVSTSSTAATLRKRREGCLLWSAKESSNTSSAINTTAKATWSLRLKGAMPLPLPKPS